MPLIPVPWPELSAFLLATVIFALSPGPAVLCIVVNGTGRGRVAALVATAGVTAGNLCSALLVALGLDLLLHLSPMVFQLLRYGGAAWLVYLGIREWRVLGLPTVAAAAPDAAARHRIFRDAMGIAFLSPMTALFFLSFLADLLVGPQATLPHMLVLALVYVVVMAITDSLYAFVSGSLQPLLLHQHWAARLITKVAALMYIAFGLYSAFAGFTAPAP